MQKIKIWQVTKTDDGQRKVASLEEVGDAQAEDLLEGLLVQEPDMLMPNLKLVGRQLGTSGGPLDLLGVDEEGRLVVFELKRGTLRREAVAQVIDYAAQLHGMDADELSEHIAERSGNGGIPKIEDFQEWYGENFPNEEADFAQLPRLALVGLGADDATRAMVSFLAESGVDITLITFYGFRRGENFLLARQVEVESSGPTPGGTWPTKADKLRALRTNAEKFGFWEMLEDIRNVVEDSTERTMYSYPTPSKYGFYLQELTDRGTLSHRIYAGAWLDQSSGQVALEFGERAYRVANDAVSQFAEKHGAEREGDWMRLRLSSAQDWERVRGDAATVFAAIYSGWKEWRKTQEQEEREEAEEE